jgi:hypothetical protein
MAIIIPSKNIYEIDNQKVRNNVVDNVTVDQTIVKPNNEYDVPVYNETFYEFGLEDVDKIKEELKTDLKLTPSNNDIYGASDAFSACSYVAYNSYKKSSFILYFPLAENNKYIKKIYTGKDDDGEPKIKYSLYGDLYEGVASSIFTSSQGDVFGVNIQPITYGEPKISRQVILDIPSEIQHIKEMTYGSFDPKQSIAEAKVYFENEGLIYSPKVEVVLTDKEYYKVEIDFYSSVRTVVMEGEYLDLWGGEKPNVSMVGNYKTYIPNEIQITINGDSIGIDLTDGSVKVGSGNKPYSLSGNELLQDSGKVEGTNLAEHLGNNVLNQYGKGKETAVLLCDINKYYDESDTLAISPNAPITFTINVDAKTEVTYKLENDGLRYATFTTTIDSPLDEDLNVIISTIDQNGYTEEIRNDIPIGSMSSTIKVINVYEYTNISTKAYYTKQEVAPNKKTFNIGDEVIPMVFSASGSDIPMSKYQNGNAKTFTVVGRDIIYDGAVWQKLYLQEKSQ